MVEELNADQLALEVDPLDDLTFEEWFLALPTMEADDAEETEA